MILLPDTNPQGALSIARSLRNKVEALGIAHVEDQHLTISIGVTSVIPTRKYSPDKLVKAADQEMYRAKKQGKNCVKYRLLE